MACFTSPVKSLPVKEVVEVVVDYEIRIVAKYSSAVAAVLSETGDSSTLLTERERKVLILLAQGDNNKHIAKKLDVSVRTIEAHRLNLRRKFNIETPAGLTKYALEQGWITISDTAK